MNVSWVSPVVAALSTEQDAVAGLFAVVAIFYVLALLVALAVYAFIGFCFWRIFTRTGHGGPLGLLVLVPGFGPIIVMLVLAFSDWPALRGAPTFDPRAT